MTYAYLGEVNKSMATHLTAKYPSHIVVTGITENGKYEIALVNATERKIAMFLRLFERRHLV